MCWRDGQWQPKRKEQEHMRVLCSDRCTYLNVLVFIAKVLGNKLDRFSSSICVRWHKVKVETIVVAHRQFTLYVDGHRMLSSQCTIWVVRCGRCFRTQNFTLKSKDTRYLGDTFDTGHICTVRRHTGRRRLRHVLPKDALMVMLVVVVIVQAGHVHHPS